MRATKPQTFNYFCLPWWRAGAGEEIKLSLPQKAQLMLSVLEFPKAEKKAQGTERVAAWQPEAFTEASYPSILES